MNGSVKGNNKKENTRTTDTQTSQTSQTHRPLRPLRPLRPRRQELGNDPPRFTRTRTHPPIWSRFSCQTQSYP